VLLCDGIDETPVMQINSDSVSPGLGVYVSIIWWSGTGEEENNQKKWEVLSNI
jgi:hypothetical protein